MFRLWVRGSNLDRTLVTESHYHVMVVRWLKWNMLVGLPRFGGQMSTSQKTPLEFVLFLAAVAG